MENPSSTKQEYSNKFPDCVFVEPLFSKDNERVVLQFTIVFGQHLAQKPYGEIRFGIKAGELRLTIQNAKLAPADIEFLKDFAITTNVHVADEVSTSNSVTEKEIASIHGTGSITPSVEARAEAQSEETIQSGNKRTLSFDYILYHIKANWDATKPRWFFHNDVLDKVLEGLVEKLKFAELGVETEQVSINYEFSVYPKDVIFTQLSVLAQAETVNKRRILKRGITRFLIGKDNILCRGEIIL